MKETQIINSVRRLADLLREIEDAWRHYGFLTVSIQAGKDRSLSQNALSHLWYAQIARELQETPEDIKCVCKLHYGVPILRAEDQGFAAWYDQLVKRRYSYPEKLELMRYTPVTSLMSAEQMKRYLDTLQAEYAKHHGIQLQRIEERGRHDQ